MAANIEFDEEDQFEIKVPAGLGCALESFSEAKIIEDLIQNLREEKNDKASLELDREKFNYVLDQYQEQPHLLDSHLDSILAELIVIARSTDVSQIIMHQCFKYLYLITKVRHYKVVVRHLPHEVADLEPALAMLKAQDPSDTETWETQYMLLLWLSIIIIIPFQLSRLDSIPIGDGYQKKPIAERVMDTALHYMKVRTPRQDAAAYLISKFVTRPDAVDLYLPQFIDWALQALVKYENEIILQRGVMATLALLFKNGKREEFLPFVRPVLKQILKLKFMDRSEMTLRKLSVKLTQRLGLTFLKPRITTWQYQRGNRSLVLNLTVKEKTSTITNEQHDADNVEMDEEDYDMPEELEDVIDQLLKGLRDEDEDVRWSAAKGVGRVTGRLPKELADEVVGSVLDLFTVRDGFNSWHGGCLALAELGRRGLLLPIRLKDVIPIVLLALVYDEQRGNYAVGSRIRDAACYVCWSFARAFDPAELAPYVEQIASALLVVTVFDRQVQCRRAASAAFQEHVGRQGAFPHGIDILTTADYFAVSNIKRSYLELSLFIAQYEEYSVPLISHLVERKVIHQDVALRELTSQALHKLTTYNSDYVITVVLQKLLQLATGNDVNARHGALLAIGETVHAVSIIAESRGKVITDIIDANLIENIKAITPTLHKNRHFEGIGGNLTRQAISSFIEKLSLAKVPFHEDELLDLWERLLEENLTNENTTVQKLAAHALPFFCTEYYKMPNGKAKPDKQSSILKLCFKNIKSANNQINRIGFTTALGELPKFMHSGYVDNVTCNLLDCARICDDAAKKWVDARMTAVAALVNICQIVGVEKDGSGHEMVNGEILDSIFTSLLKSLEDYTSDPSRGDIGARVREAAMTGLQTLINFVNKFNPELISEELSNAVMTGLAQQAQEKIDRTRALAATTFVALLHSEPPLPHIPHHEELLSIFPKASEAADIMWIRPQETYVLFIQLLKFPTYTYSVLLGLVVSVGGNIENVVKHSSAALFNYLKSISGNGEETMRLLNTFLQLFRDHHRAPRLSLSLLNTADQLLCSGTLTDVIEDETCDFAEHLWDCIKLEVARTNEFSKISAAGAVYCELLHSHQLVRKRALFQLAVYLCHKFSNIRVKIANGLYESLILCEGDWLLEENRDEIMSILSDTDWYDELETLRPIRNRFCELLNIPIVKLVTAAKPVGK